MSPCRRFTIGLLPILIAFSASGSERTRALYTELFIYRTKVDHTQNYTKKLWTLIDAGVEHTPDDVLDERMKQIDGTTTGLDNAASALSKLPGYFGKIGNFLQLYNFSNRAEQGSSMSGSDITDDTAKSARRGLEVLYQLLQKNPAFAAKVNKYLGTKVGPVNGSADEIIKASPDFQQFKRVEDIKKAVADQKVAEQKVAEMVKEIKDRIAEEQKAQHEQESYTARERDIQEYTAYGNLLARFVGFSNPTLSRDLSLAVTVYEKGATVLNQLAHHMMSSPAAAANLMLIGMDLVSGLTGSSPDLAILSALRDIQRQIQESTEAILKQLDALDAKLEDMHRLELVMYDKLMNQQESLSSLHAKLDKAEHDLLLKDAFLFNATRAGFDRPLGDVVTAAVGYKRIFRPAFQHKDPETFRRDLTALYSWSTQHSSDALATGSPLNRNYDPSSYLVELTQYPDSTNLIYVRKVLQQLGGLKLPELGVDPDTWFLSSAALYTLIADWPEYQNQLDPAFLDEVIAKGGQVTLVSDNLSFRHASTAYIKITEHAADETDKYINGVLKSVAENIRGDALKRGRIVFPAAIDPTLLGSMKGADVVKLFGAVQPQHISGEITYVSGTWGTKPVSFSPAAMQKILPATAKFAFHLGLVSPDCKITYDHHGKRFDEIFRCDMVSKVSNKRYTVASAERHITTNFVNEECMMGCPSAEVTAQYLADMLFPNYAADMTAGINKLADEFRDKFAEYLAFQSTEAKKAYDQTSVDAKTSAQSQTGFRQLLLTAIVLSDPQWLTTSEKLAKLAGSAQMDLDHLGKGLFVDRTAVDVGSDVASWQREVIATLQDLTANSETEAAFPEVRLTVQHLGELRTALANRSKYPSDDARQRAASRPAAQVPNQ